MKENILEIHELLNVEGENNDWKTYDGYEIITDRQRIKILIENDQNCCESWGYLASEDDFTDFIGAELYKLTETNTALKTVKVPAFLDEGGVIFVNIETSKGTLQFAVYNGHNGYYGHSVKVISDDLNIDSAL
ncbi:MAG TPA: hypothetical protein VHO03_16875 [Ignavibacteriales bacterium]|nr:hypothetical protein [Ignavibacteriales bacterium]